MSAGVHHDNGRLAVERGEYEAQLREQQHQEEVLRRLADPSTPEGAVAQKAYRRIAELLEELKLDDSHLELATQASNCSCSSCACFPWAEKGFADSQ